MASSLSPACNTSKHEYDTCFNHWFKSYLMLVSPPLQHPSSSKEGEKERLAREKKILQKKEEYEKNCGGFYSSYQSCLKREIGTKEGLSDMIESARKEEPLDGWGGIKVVTDDDLKA